jgi:hypothetical protein
MNSFSEVFRELDFEDAAEARQKRDLRLSQLQEQGLVCVGENLYHVEGWRVFTLVATPPSRLITPAEALSESLSNQTLSSRSTSRERTKSQQEVRPQRRAFSSSTNQSDLKGNRRSPIPKRNYEVR